MPSQVLITMDDLEVAVRLNAALEAAGLRTAMFSALDDAGGALRRGRRVPERLGADPDPGSPSRSHSEKVTFTEEAS